VSLLTSEVEDDLFSISFLFNLASEDGGFMEHSAVTSLSPLFFIHYGEKDPALGLLWNEVRTLLTPEGELNYQLELCIKV
jgi:hypothetical protein